SGRAAVVALVLGAASVTAMPAMAQSEPSFNFRLGIGSGGGFDFGIESRSRDFDRLRFCLTNNQIRRGLRDYGFRDIEIVRDNRQRVEVIARYGRAWYRLRVSRCTGEVRVIERLRRGFPGSGFGLQFNFGN
ncbi:MAG: hypothetical protein Q8L54_00360, partial [Devosia sp.]|nr:hypothetical protein [Devosia sp.]